MHFTYFFNSSYVCQTQNRKNVFPSQFYTHSDILPTLFTLTINIEYSFASNINADLIHRLYLV